MARDDRVEQDFLDTLAQFSDAQATLTKHGQSFRFAQRFLGRETATAAAKLYQFCRISDDLVDEAPNSNVARLRLASLRQTLKSSKLPKSLQGFQDVQRAYAIPQLAIDELLNGIETDLTETTKPDEAALLQYCFRVAGTVGMMMRPILGAPARAEAYAIDMGVAMQLTNIARDVLEDAHNGRIYLPQTLLGTICVEDIIHPTPAQQLIVQNAIKYVLDLAEYYYDSAMDGLAYIPRRNSLAMHFALYIYREIGVELAQRHYDYTRGRVMLSQAQKVWSALRYAPRFLFITEPLQHSDSLHFSFEHLYRD
jgi:phytoene synthase